jgi:hypothetical protein
LFFSFWPYFFQLLTTWLNPEKVEDLPFFWLQCRIVPQLPIIHARCGTQQVARGPR